MAKRRRAHKLTEFSEEFESYCVRIEEQNDVAPLSSRAELAILDVWHLIGGVEGDGLHSFWDDGYDHHRVIESCRLVGATELAATLQESSWAREVILRGTDERGQYLFTSEEADNLDVLEDRVYDEFQRCADLATAFMQQLLRGK